MVKQDPRFKNEKEKRHQETIQRNKKYYQNYNKSYTRPKKENNAKEDYERMQAQLYQDTLELSAPRTQMSNRQMVYSNLGAYHTNKNGNLTLDKNITATSDMPRNLNRNVKVPTQKYKHRVCMER